MNPNHLDIEKRREKIEESNKAIDSLNDKSEIKANLLKLFDKWDNEDAKLQNIQSKELNGIKKDF